MLKKFYLIFAFILFIPTLFLTLIFLLSGIYAPEHYQVEEIPDEQFINFKNGKIRLQTVGKGKQAILFLHGFNGSMNDWDNVWPLIQSSSGILKNTRIIRVDIPGFGLSQWDTTDYSLQAQSQRFIALLDRLKIDSVILVGTSMGGSLSAIIAANNPDRVKAILMMAPSGYTDSLAAGLVGGLVYRPGMINRLISTVSTSPIYKTVFPQSRLLQALTVTGSYGSEWVKALKKITQPTRILWSKSDNRVDFKYAQIIRDLIPSSKLILASTKAGHNIPKLDAELLSREIFILLAEAALIS